MKPQILYNIVLWVGDQRIVIDWGNRPGWQNEYKDELDNADYIWLIPKEEESPLPKISTSLHGNRKWILFSRVFGTNKAGLDTQVRLYAIGWQGKVDKRNVKSIAWIYPSGEIEVSGDPSFADVFLKSR